MELTDKEFLEWIFERLVHVHKENPSYAYMHKLRAIIKDYSEDKVTKWW